jgi:hypothetical protein
MIACALLTSCTVLQDFLLLLRSLTENSKNADALQVKKSRTQQYREKKKAKKKVSFANGISFFVLSSPSLSVSPLSIKIIQFSQ